MRDVLESHVVCGVHRVPGGQVTRKRQLVVLVFLVACNVFVRFGSELCVHPGWKRWFLDDWTTERDIIVVGCAYTSSAYVTPLDHSAFLAPKFATLFPPVDETIVSIAYGSGLSVSAERFGTELMMDLSSSLVHDFTTSCFMSFRLVRDRYFGTQRTNTMCWSATTSLVTFVVGTLLNLGSYALLRRTQSPTSLLVWSWQYALLMQIPEGIVWLQLDAGHDDISAASRLAMVLNITQPIALLLGIRFGGLYREFRYAYVALLLYAVVLATQFDEVWSKSASIAPNEDCPHLSLRYWDVSRGIVYLVSSLLVVSEARPVFWASVNAALFSLTFLLAIVVYPCGIGSVWCWFVFVTGPILVVCDRVRDRFVNSDGTPRRSPQDVVVVAPGSTLVHHRSRV